MNLIDNAIIRLARTGITPVLKQGKMCFTTTNTGADWIFIKHHNHNCTMLMSFIYKLIVKSMPKKDRFVPSECQNCYQVFIHPESYNDLLELYPIMEELNLPSKIGIEKREEVDALYGAYFYFDSLEDGLKQLDKINFALQDTTMQAFLKKGCYEYELGCGCSDTWNITKKQKEFEKEIYSRVDIEDFKRPQTNTDIKKTLKNWEEFADLMGHVYKGTHNYTIYGDKKCQKQIA